MIENSVNDIDPMQAFIQAAWTKYINGRRKYGPEWQGQHPANEYLEEQLDSKSYLDWLHERRLISRAEYDEGVRLHFQAWWWMNQVLKRVTNRA